MEGPESIIDGSDSANNLGPTSEIVETAKYRYEYDPSHPDADENGMVQYPDVDIREMASMVSANRLYEANLSVIEAAKQIMKKINGDIMKINFNIPNILERKENIQSRDITPTNKLPDLTQRENESIQQSFKNDFNFQSYDYSGSRKMSNNFSGSRVDLRG